MPFLGNTINFFAVLIFAALGAVVKRGIPDRIKNAIFAAVAICVIYIGLSGALEEAPSVSEGAFFSPSLGKFVIMILSLVIGTAIGEIIDIDKWVTRLGVYLENKFTKAIPDSAEMPSGESSPGGGSFARGFVSTTIMVSVGAMAVNGAILDATGSPDVLIAKATIDAIACFILATNLGIGCAFAAFPMALYQGTLTLIAIFFTSFIPAAWITYLSVTGSLIIVLIGTNFLGMTNVKTANMTPAVFMPLAIAPLMELLGLI